jgi:glycyl-tRNA synthetase beta chain
MPDLPNQPANAGSPGPGTASFLLEIGVEELPSGAVASAVEQFRTALLSRLETERLGVLPDTVQIFATPRRLAFFVAGVPLRQPDAEQEVRGPSVRSAFAPDGTPTKAAEGFAAKNGVPVEALVVQGDYVTVRRVEQGRSAAEVLAQAIPDLLKTITFPKFMRWGEGNYRFGRPLRRFIALLGEDVIPFTVEGVAAGRETAGHRYSKGAVTIPVADANAYAAALRAAFVEPDPAVRRRRIIDDAQILARSVGGTAILPEALIEENVYLTEWVTGVLGTFDPVFLALPRPVLETAMKKHQRFFPVEGPSGTLLPHFIAIRNGDDEHLETVRAGYEKVLSSRFNDARFFFEHDRATPLAEKVARTERIIFQEKLGTLADKARRMEAVLRETHLFGWTHDAEHARRAAHLAKADLVTETVMELPALQGVMGREFALLDGEPGPVADALFEHYLPRFAGDALPHGRIGTVLALADRADTLVGYLRFVGAEPKGSSDPFGLKRAASAVIDLLARDRSLPTSSALLAAAEHAFIAQNLIPAQKPVDPTALLEARLRSLLEERGVRYDLIDALLSAPWDNVASVVARAKALGALLSSDEEVQVATAATRVRNILRGVKEVPEETPNRTLLTTPEERALLAFLQTVGPQADRALQNGDYTDALDTLAALSAPIDRLFDHVMILADDLAVRTARLALLAMADRLYLRLADFSRLVTE